MSAAEDLILRQFPSVAQALSPACKGGAPRKVVGRDGDRVECGHCNVALPAGYERVPGCSFEVWCRR